MLVLDAVEYFSEFHDSLLLIHVGEALLLHDVGDFAFLQVTAVHIFGFQQLQLLAQLLLVHAALQVAEVHRFRHFAL